jgi:glyoxylase-like metal-dependent hydrolase (beta-lactamase superfamily II)
LPSLADPLASIVSLMSFERTLALMSSDPTGQPSLREGRADRLYFRQLLSGRDFAADDPMAVQMVNFVYAIGDRDTGECVLIDPAYDPAGLIDTVTTDGMRVVGVLATHYHADHIGGSIMGFDIAGVAGLLERIDCPVHVQRDEVPWVVRASGVTDDHLVPHDSGDVVRVGEIDIQLVHTPGHTPGSQCFLVDTKLVSGDTLFLDGCGRTDLPGSNPAQMIESLRRLSRVDDGVVLYPGHRYSPASCATMEAVKRSNYVFDQLLGH